MAEEPENYYCGLVEVVPKASQYVSSGKRRLNDSKAVERSSRIIYKDPKSGISNQFIKKHKAVEFVNKQTGSHGYKEEMNYISTQKFHDKSQGVSGEYQTQVKFKKVIYSHNNTNSKSKNKSIGYY